MAFVYPGYPAYGGYPGPIAPGVFPGPARFGPAPFAYRGPAPFAAPYPYGYPAPYPTTTAPLPQQPQQPVYQTPAPAQDVPLC